MQRRAGDLHQRPWGRGHRRRGDRSHQAPTDAGRTNPWRRSPWFSVPTNDYVPSGRLRLEIGHSRYGGALAADRKRWTIEQRLGVAIRKLEDNAQDAEEHRDDGNFWVGLGHNGGYSATDVWRFNPYSLEWTWMSGSPNAAVCTPIGTECDTSYTNQPGGRFENRTTWKISDELIMTYAGKSCNNNYYNDLWAYLPLSSTWVKLDEWPLPGHYGTIGVSSALDYPKHRIGAAGFKDKDNALWVYSGRTLWTDGNDLWKYEIDWYCLPDYVSGLVDEVPPSMISVYPNPVGPTATLEMGRRVHHGVLMIFNALGEHVLQQDVSGYSTTLHFDGMPSGIYFYHLTSNGQVVANGRILR